MDGIPFIFTAGGQVKSPGDVRVAVESYLDAKGVLAFESNFCRIFEYGFEKFAQAKMLAQFSRWKYKLALEYVRRYCLDNQINLSASVVDGRWQTSITTTGGYQFAKADDDLEVAIALALTDLEVHKGKRPELYRDRRYR